MIASIASRRLVLLMGFAGFFSPLGAQQRGDDTILRLLMQGTRAFAGADTAEATKAFDVAATAIGGIWGGSPEAQKARSLWYEESVKPFRGDPYERMMAFYYRGLLYLQGRDWGNAQAAFRNSVQQDAFAEEDQHNDDVAASLFLQGWSLQAQGSMTEAAEAYRVLTQRRPDFPVPDVAKPQPNVLIIAETGFGPRKVPDGVGSYRLRFFRGKNFTEARTRVVVDGDVENTLVLYPMEDVYWQAVSRGGRQVDAIFEGKARFAERTEITGSALTAISSDLSIRKYAYDGNTSKNISVAADAMGIASIAALAFSVRAKPAVDSRYWDNLPDALHFATLTLPPGKHELRFSFETAAGAVLPDLERRVEVNVSKDAASTIAWVSSRDRQSPYLNKLAANGGSKP